MAQKNSLQHIILGLLNHGELAGYDIKKLFDSELGDFWYANHSQIYPELRRLQEEGLIAARIETVGTRLEKKIYRITEKGKEALAEWMKEPLGSLIPSRDEFTMKLYLISDAKDPLALALFEEDIERHQKKYDYLRSRWQTLFQDKAEQERHYGHAAILKQAMHREKQRLDWLTAEYKALRDMK